MPTDVVRLFYFLLNATCAPIAEAADLSIHMSAVVDAMSWIAAGKQSLSLSSHIQEERWWSGSSSNFRWDKFFRSQQNLESPDDSNAFSLSLYLVQSGLRQRHHGRSRVTVFPSTFLRCVWERGWIPAHQVASISDVHRCMADSFFLLTSVCRCFVDDDGAHRSSCPPLP